MENRYQFYDKTTEQLVQFTIFTHKRRRQTVFAVREKRWARLSVGDHSKRKFTKSDEMAVGVNRPNKMWNAVSDFTWFFFSMYVLITVTKLMVLLQRLLLYQLLGNHCRIHWCHRFYKNKTSFKKSNKHLKSTAKLHTEK